MRNSMTARCLVTVTLVGAAALTVALAKPRPTTAANVSSPVATAVAVMTPTMLSGARAEIQSQTGTTLNMKFFDSTNAQYTLNFARPTTNDVWKATTSESLGIVFGNENPRYAGAATRKSLGITLDQAVQTFNTSIVNRPFDDLTIYKTYGGMAIGLWQQGSITEIWYVGEFVQALVQEAQDPDPDQSMCQAALAICCSRADPANNATPGDMKEACQAALLCPNQKLAACACLDTLCGLCHPQPDPPTPPCSGAVLALSEAACLLGAPPCQLPPPPDVPAWVQDIIDLLEEILNRLQEWLNQQHQL